MKLRNTVILVTTVVCLSIWIFDTIIGFLFYSEGATFMELLIFAVPFHDLYERLILIIISVIVGAIYYRLFENMENIVNDLSLITQLLDAIRNVNQLIVHETDIDKLIQESVNQLTQIDSFLHAFIVLFDEGGSVTKSAGSGTDLQMDFLLKAIHLNVKINCISIAMKASGAHMFFESSEGHNDCPLRDIHRGKIALAVGLESRGRKYGVLVLSAHPDTIHEDEIELLEDVAGDIAFALYSMEIKDDGTQAHKRLIASEERHRALVQSMHDLVFVYDEMNRHSECHVSQDHLLYVPAEQFLGKTISDVLPPEVVERLEHAISEVRRTGNPQMVDYALEINNRIHWFSAFLNPHEDGRSVVSVVRDITERKLAEEAQKESEIRFRMLFEITPVSIVLTELDGSFIETNELMESISGYSRDELKAMKVSALYVQEEKRNRVLDELHETGRVRNFEVELKRKDGTTYYALLNEDLIELGGKKVCFATIQDITELKKAQKQLVDAQRIAHLGSWDWDIERNIIEWSDEIYRIFGVKPQEVKLTYETFLAFVHPDDKNNVMRAVDKALTEGTDYSIDHRIVRSDGSEGTVHEQGMVLFADNGTPKLMIGTVQDITERKSSELINIAIAETADLYLDIMGHDIRNHLQAIIISSEIIESIVGGDEVTSAIEMIVESVVKSKDMISKVHAAKDLLNIPLTTMSLKVALENAIHSLVETYNDVEISVEYNVQESDIIADKYLELLFNNILENAVIHNNREKKQIWVELHEADRGYIVSIMDNGPSISDGFKETLFDPSRRFGGVGVHQVIMILRKYGGNISVHDRMLSDSSQGARFDIWFPKLMTSVNPGSG